LIPSHGATLRDGKRVAVKVQYPDIVASLEADLRNLGLLGRMFCIMAPSQRPGTIFAELSERFSEECDYTHEAANIQYFTRFFEGRNDIRIPQVVESLSTRRILTLDLAEGVSLDAFAKSANQDERNRAGQAIWEFFYTPTQLGGRFHADPHDANLMFQDGAVVFLDFGRVGRSPLCFSLRHRTLLASLREIQGRVLDLAVSVLIERAVKESGARVVSADGVGNGDGAADAFLRAILDAVAAYERELIRARTRAAMAVKRTKSERSGKIPYGLTLAGEGQHLVSDEFEQSVIARAEAWDRGLSRRRYRRRG
jgi:hypothetical protein